MVSNGFQSEVAYSNFYFENITGAVLVTEEAEGEVVKKSILWFWLKRI